jgi:hypothetical protein
VQRSDSRINTAAPDSPGASGDGREVTILSDTLSTGLGGFSVRLLAFTRLSVECFSGLLERNVIVSRVKTSLLSVRRSFGGGGARDDFLDWDCDCAAVALALAFSLSPAMELEA